MALTNTAIPALKRGAKDYKAADEKGLHLLVTPTLASGVDPAEKKRRDRQAAEVSAANSVTAVAQSYIDKGKDAVRAARHRGSHRNERVEMAQWWTDYFDTLRTAAKVIKFHRQSS